MATATPGYPEHYGMVGQGTVGLATQGPDASLQDQVGRVRRIVESCHDVLSDMEGGATPTPLNRPVLPGEVIPSEGLIQTTAILEQQCGALRERLNQLRNRIGRL